MRGLPTRSAALRPPPEVTVAALGLAAALAVACVLLVALPLVRERRTPDGSAEALPDADTQRLRLLEERDRLLAAVQDLELDRDLQKISDEDYQFMRASLRRDVGSVLVKLDAAGPRPTQGSGATAADARESSLDVPGEASQPSPAADDDRS